MASDHQQEILQLLRENAADGLRKSEIRRRLKLRTRPELASFRTTFDKLVRSGAIVRQHRGRYRIQTDSPAVPGRLSLHRRGYGFVQPDAPGKPDIFIPPHASGDALPGDRVLVVLTDPHADRGPVGRIERVLVRERGETVGQLVETRTGLFFRPLRTGYPDLIDVENSKETEEKLDLPPGAWVNAVLRRTKLPRHPFAARVQGRATEASGIDGTLDAIVTEYDLPEPYTQDQCRFAADCSPVDLPRTTVDHPAVVTIDPEDAKDFDDALSAVPGPEPGTVIVGVHIADVAAYVTPASDLDSWARLRGFTSYLPGRTLPMLPEPLAANLCSLREGEERPAHSVFLTVRKEDGEILDSRRCRTTVRVDRRLSFREVQEFLDGRGQSLELSPEVGRSLELLGATFRVMRQRRAEIEHFLDLNKPEVRVRCTEAPTQIIGLTRTAPDAANALVEEFMLAANTAVARELLAREIPGVFRCHPDPKPRDLTVFRTWVREVLHISAGRVSDRAGVNRLLRQLADLSAGELGLQTLLRALPRAVYSAECRPHYGLGKNEYCHFTSPIRRYPDLVVHQQLLALDTDRSILRPESECDAISSECTEKEQQVDEAYYAALDRLKLHYLHTMAEDGEHPIFEAVAARLDRYEATLYVPELGMFGTLRWRSLPADRFQVSQDGNSVRGPRTGFRLRRGDVLYVEPRTVDCGRGIFELVPVRPRMQEARRPESAGE